MAELRSVVLALIVGLLFVTFGVSMFSKSAENGGYTSLPNFPLANSIARYNATMSDFETTLANATQSTPNADTTGDAATAYWNFAIAGGKTISLVFQAVGIMADFLSQSGLSLGGIIPSYFFFYAIMFVVIMMTLIILGMILKWWV